jgi:hypothetical protein
MTGREHGTRAAAPSSQRTETVEAFVARTTAASGVPYHLEDPAIAAVLAALLAGRERSGPEGPLRPASCRLTERNDA